MLIIIKHLLLISQDVSYENNNLKKTEEAQISAILVF